MTPHVRTREKVQNPCHPSLMNCCTLTFGQSESWERTVHQAGGAVLYFLKNKTGNGSHRLPFFRPRPSLIPLCRGKKDKKVGGKFVFSFNLHYLFPLEKILPLENENKL